MSVVVTIESLAAGGDGVAHTTDGRVVFVPHAAVGDVVEIELTKQKKSFARGEIRTIKTASSDRKESGCELFDRAACGGCQWLHISESAQRAAKRDVVVSALRHVAEEKRIAPIEAPTPALQWRRRARFHWFRPGSGDAVVGFIAPKSKRVTALAGCVQLEPSLFAAYQLIARELATHLHKRGEIDVVVGHDDRALVSVRGPHSRRGLEALAKNPSIAGVVGRGAPIGEASIDYEEGLPVSAQSFAQASLSGNRALAEGVFAAVSSAPHGHVLELFAGGGNFTRAIAASADRVVAVERASGPRIERDNVRWMRVDSSVALKQLAAGSAPPFDVVVLDPPRTGAADCIEGLLSLAPARIVYVSCDPATLARDLARLCLPQDPEQGLEQEDKNGEKAPGRYTVRSITPIDLMPQTAHVEVIAVLERRR